MKFDVELRNFEVRPMNLVDGEPVSLLLCEILRQLLFWMMITFLSDFV